MKKIILSISSLACSIAIFAQNDTKISEPARGNVEPVPATFQSSPRPNASTSRPPANSSSSPKLIHNNTNSPARPNASAPTGIQAETQSIDNTSIPSKDKDQDEVDQVFDTEFDDSIPAYESIGGVKIKKSIPIEESNRQRATKK